MPRVEIIAHKVNNGRRLGPTLKDKEQFVFSQALHRLISF